MRQKIASAKRGHLDLNQKHPRRDFSSSFLGLGERVRGEEPLFCARGEPLLPPDGLPSRLGGHHPLKEIIRTIVRLYQ